MNHNHLPWGMASWTFSICFIRHWRGKVESHFSKFDAQLGQSNSSVSMILV
jgi:hypothetical protein